MFKYTVSESKRMLRLQVLNNNNICNGLVLKADNLLICKLNNLWANDTVIYYPLNKSRFNLISKINSIKLIINYKGLNSIPLRLSKKHKPLKKTKLKGLLSRNNSYLF